MTSDEQFVEETPAHRRAIRTPRLIAVGSATALLLALALLVFAIYSIQDSRLSSCRDTNQRNARTRAALHDLYLPDEKGASPKKKAALEASFTRTARIIDALAPVRNCSKTVKLHLGVWPG